jgi:methylmalonyl-CoA/ethylmalonyl-CoA epimerase
VPGVIGTCVVTRIRILVRDVETATRKWSDFLGIEPEIGPVGCGKGPAMNVIYLGQPALEAEIRATLFRVAPNFYIELMQPNEFPSVWRDVLDSAGEGLHSIGFFVEDLSHAVRSSLEFGAELLQSGDFGTGDGRYAYLDFRKHLQTIVEIEQTDVPFQDILESVKAALKRGDGDPPRLKEDVRPPAFGVDQR